MPSVAFRRLLESKSPVMKRFIIQIAFVVAGLLLLTSCTKSNANNLIVAISPYQDIAMLVNYKHLKLDKEYHVNIQLRTLAWEDILPAVASSGPTVDVGFGSLTEYLTKYSRLNSGSSDPIVFVYPLYVYRGGGFISFNPNVVPLTEANINDRSSLRKFLSFRIGAQKESIYDMIISSLARRAGIPLQDINVIDTSMNDGFLAAQSHSLDIASAGLTQITEAEKRGGTVVLSMDNAGFADVTGFICRASTLKQKHQAISALIRIWFDCVHYVTSDIRQNSVESLRYLNSNASTHYTLEQYRAALSQEYFPTSIAQANAQLINKSGKFSAPRIASEISSYIRGRDPTAKTPRRLLFMEIKQ